MHKGGLGVILSTVVRLTATFNQSPEEVRQPAMHIDSWQKTFQLEGMAVKALRQMCLLCSRPAGGRVPGTQHIRAGAVGRGHPRGPCSQCEDGQEASGRI